MNRKAMLMAAAAAALATMGGRTQAARADSSSDKWNWLEGDERAYAGGAATGDSLELFGLQTVNITSQHLRLVARDGNFEFEHAASVPSSTLNSYVAGTSRRTPISIGGWDTQDIVSLVVGGAPRQKSDIQQWQVGGRTTAAIDGAGNLRLGGVTLAMAVENGKAVLYAVLPDGTRQVLAAAAGATPVTASAKTTATAAAAHRTTSSTVK